MRIYANSRSWPTRLMLWLCGGGTVAALIHALYSHLTGSEAVLGLIFAAFLALMTLMLEAIARHLVLSIDVEDGSIAVDTMTILGRKRRVLAEASVGDERKAYRVDSPDFDSVIGILGGVAELMSGKGDEDTDVDGRWRPFRVPGKRIPLLLDVTADPEAGARIAETIAGAGRQNKDAIR